MRNAFALDGMHWCSETLNGRLNAGIAYFLLGCLLNDDEEMAEDCGNQPFLDCCETTCNEQFMSLDLVKDFDVLD